VSVIFLSYYLMFRGVIWDTVSDVFILDPFIMPCFFDLFNFSGEELWLVLALKLTLFFFDFFDLLSS